MLACLFADDTVLFTESEKELQRVVDEFYSLCTKRKLKVKVGKCKVMIFERREVEVVDFNTPYKMSANSRKVCGSFRRENGGSERI